MTLRRQTGWTIVLVGCIICTSAFAAGTRASLRTVTRSAQDSARTTLDSVFSEQQANRGKQIFASTCGSCHATTDESGDTFDSKWKDHSLIELFTYINTQMPQNDPGSLDPYTTIDVVAYMLKLNNMPTGAADLTPDTLLLKNIRITRIKGSTR